MDSRRQELVRRRRGDLGWSIARAAREAGVSPTTWGRYETGQGTPQQRTLQTMRQALAISDAEWDLEPHDRTRLLLGHPSGAKLEVEVLMATGPLDEAVADVSQYLIGYGISGSGLPDANYADADLLPDVRAAVKVLRSLSPDRLALAVRLLQALRG
jgi:transcriptional regulator with XRE-family HTH domain